VARRRRDPLDLQNGTRGRASRARRIADRMDDLLPFRGGSTTGLSAAGGQILPACR